MVSRFLVCQHIHKSLYLISKIHSVYSINWFLVKDLCVLARPDVGTSLVQHPDGACWRMLINNNRN